MSVWVVDISGLEPDGPRTYDLTVVKRVEHLLSRDVLLRLALTSIVMLMLFFVFEIPEALIALGLYTSTVLVHGMIVARLPVTVGYYEVRVVQAGTLMVGVAWNAGLVILWLQDDMAVRIIALVGIFAAMLNAMMLRHQDQLLANIDIISILMGLVGLPLASYLFLDAQGEALSLALAGAMVFVFFAIGLTEIRQTRRALTQANAEAAEHTKIEALGRLTGGVAHDFNNLLTVIGGNLDLIRETSDPDQKDELARQASFATAQAAKVTEQLLTFVGRATLQPDIINVRSSVNVVVAQLERVFSTKIKLKVTIDDDVPDLLLDLRQFEDVLLGLCHNARDAMPEGGDLLITAQRISWGERKGSMVADGQIIGIEVTDTGIGIPPDALKRVCEPYFSSRGLGHAGGLGLASAKGFAEQSGGSLSISSVVGEGTTVTLLLPVPSETG